NQELGRVGVDLARQLDEARGQAVLPGEPGQVKRIDGDAMAAEARAWVERLVAERLGLGRLDYFPDVDTHAVVQDFQLVDEGDVDRPITVFQDLARLGDFQTADAHHGDNRLAV